MRPPILLVIEDEERMRRLLELVLKPEGYELILAKTGEEGIRALSEVQGFDLIVTDLAERDRKSTRLNSSHVKISYAVFCLKKKRRAAGRPSPRPTPSPRGSRA